MVRETAAAAIAVRSSGAGAEVCLFQAAGEQWSVPWSVVESGEVPKQTALRALQELGGVEANLTDVDPRFYKTIEQVYRKGIDKLRREVHFFRVRIPEGAGSGEAVWVPAQEAVDRVTSKAVREVLTDALGAVLAQAGSEGSPTEGAPPPPPPPSA